LKKLEESLQSFEPSVTLPYWDQTDDSSLYYGIPTVLTDETYTFSDGSVIPNPLRSFIFPKEVFNAQLMNLKFGPNQRDMRLLDIHTQVKFRKKKNRQRSTIPNILMKKL
jgi:hypothetical protein